MPEPAKIDRQAAGSDGKPAPERASGQPDPAPVVEFTAAEKLSVTLTPDGTINFDKLRTRTRGKLVKALSDPQLPGQLGIAAPAAAASAQIFDVNLCGILYTALGNIMMLGAAKGGYPADQVRAMMFSPEEIKFLAPPTGKVLDKYLGASLLKYSDEAALVIALGTVLTGKLSQLKKPGDVIQFPQAAPAAPAPAPIVTPDPGVM